MPPFCTRSAGNQAYEVRYSDDDPSVEQHVTQISVARCEKLLPDSLLGPEIVEDRLRELTGLNPSRSPVPQEGRGGTCEIAFFLYFEDRPRSDEAADAIAGTGLHTRVEPGAKGTWLVTATECVPCDAVDKAIKRREPHLADVAQQYAGEYDGYEHGVSAQGAADNPQS